MSLQPRPSRKTTTIVTSDAHRRAVARAPSLPTSFPPIVHALPAWAELHDDELLQLRVCDLDLAIAGTELQARTEQLDDELAVARIPLRPLYYLGDEWFTPTGSTRIALPFYLAHPRLRQLERRQMRELEGGTDEECMKLLRHECGHVFDHAYRFSRRPEWRRLFGRSDAAATPDVYRPRPYSKSYVRHLKNSYAQAHPDEDFAETFAVVLGTPEAEWRARYRGWRAALEKLEYVASLVREAARRAPPARRDGTRISDARRMKKTLARYYADRRRACAEDFPDFLDPDLHRIFGTPEASPLGADSAARFMRRRRDAIVSAVVSFSGAHKYAIDELLRRLIARCEALALVVNRDEPRTLLELGAYLSAMVTTHLHTGHYKRRV